MKDLNCCALCGQPLDLIEETWAEDKAVMVQNRGEYCLSCYQDMVERQRP